MICHDDMITFNRRIFIVIPFHFFWVFCQVGDGVWSIIKLAIFYGTIFYINKLYQFFKSLIKLHIINFYYLKNIIGISIREIFHIIFISINWVKLLHNIK